MKGKTLTVGVLLVAAAAIATDARAWLVGKLLDAITPAGGWDAANIIKMPWGSIIGVPVFLVASLWLLWEVFGRASFRARFGSDRALAEFVQPIEDEVIDTQKQIRSLFSALGSIRDREKLQEAANRIEETARPIDTLAHDSGVLSGGQEMLLMQFEGEWEDSLAYWLSIAQPYDGDLVDGLVEIPNGAFDTDLPNSANFITPETMRLYQGFSVRMEAWRKARGTIERKVDEAAFDGKTLFKRMGGTLPVIGEHL